MATYYLETPISEEAVRRLKVRDTVYLSGEMFTARDSAHRRALEYVAEGKKIAIDMKGKALFHCGPLVKANGTYRIISAGPTTSTRMEMFEDEFIEKFGVRVVIGKGGMGLRTTEACKRFGAVYCAFTGGAGAQAGEAITRVKSVEWLDLGMPEALWILEIKEFGPLTVAIDSYGTNLYVDVAKQVEKNKEQIYNSI
ncbi:MAG: fumarate hydratase C-terminal domain-containing protein [Candidatus Bathyarchaeota archaeon]|nr:MAG: fumarate hydratase C-terminal domain-containing protein [Candidatus Bathyarchaeota archaeon]